jgi:hypothetical protein
VNRGQRLAALQLWYLALEEQPDADRALVEQDRAELDADPDGFLARWSDEAMADILWRLLLAEQDLSHTLLADARRYMTTGHESRVAYWRLTGARTAHNVRRGQLVAAEVARMREAGEKVDYIAAKLGITPRQVTALTPQSRR